MSTYEPTIQFATNLGRPEIEERLARVRSAAQEKKLDDLAMLFSEVQGMPRAQLEQRVKSASAWLRGKPEHARLAFELEVIEINLPNLK